MKILSIVVTYNATNKNWLHKCLKSLENSLIKSDILVIDNNSTDDTTAIIEREYKNIHLIKSELNLGFAKANNLGFDQAIDKDYDFIFLLNQDAWIEKSTLKQLVYFSLNNPNYGIISPIHLNGEGNNLDLLFHEYIAKPNNKLVYDALSANSIKKHYEVEFVNAACWLITKKCFNATGKFDEVLFTHYGEDENYVNRVKNKGYKVTVLTSCFVYHDRQDRGTEKQKSIFVNERTDELRYFTKIGSNINNINFVKDMDRHILRSYYIALSNLAKFNFKKFIFHLQLSREKKKLKKTITIQRSKY